MSVDTNDPKLALTGKIKSVFEYELSAYNGLCWVGAERNELSMRIYWGPAKFTDESLVAVSAKADVALNPRFFARVLNTSVTPS